MNRESADGRYAAVYLFANAEHDQELSEIYHKTSPPTISPDASDTTSALSSVYRNIQRLLDEDQGNCHEVYLCSHTQNCIERLETYANTIPTAVLIELSDVSDSSAPLLCNSHKRVEAFPFLRALHADVTGAHYQRCVMPFALISSSLTVNSGTRPIFDSTLTEKCLNAGAIDIVHSPLEGEDLDRLIGHIKEITRPSAHLLGASMAQNLVDSINSTTKTNVAQHRPDECLSAERKSFVESIIGQWSFPAHTLNMDELTYGALLMLERLTSLADLAPHRLERGPLVTFLLATRRQYKHEKQVHYHNWRHAVDVTQSIFCFLLAAGICPRLPQDREARDPAEVNALERLLTPLDALMLLVSAIGHDVGHPGVNNAFLVACSHPLAQMYNDKSVLENYHCAAYSQLLRRHWPSLSGLDGFRSTMISNVLATDMQRHFEYMSNLSDLKRKVDNSLEGLLGWKEKDCNDARSLLMALLMKAADISNVARPFDVSAKWAKILMTEFSRQAELEKELDMPTCLFGGPPNPGDLLAAAQSQKGFMDLFGIPLFQGMTELMPGVGCAMSELRKNMEIWEDKIAREKDSEKPSEHPVTFASVTADEVHEAEVRHHRSEPTAVPVTVGQPPTDITARQAVLDVASIPNVHPSSRYRGGKISFEPASEEDDNKLPPLSGSRLISPSTGISSRRSSKDVALEQFQQLTSQTHYALNNGTDSRRGSADAGWQIRHSHPNSRRGSKDESLTTILLTSQASPARRASPAPNLSPSRTIPSTTKSSMAIEGLRDAGVRADTVGSSTSPSLVLNTGSVDTGANTRVGFSSSDVTLDRKADRHPALSQKSLLSPSTPPTPDRHPKSASPYIMTRVTSGGTEDTEAATSTSSRPFVQPSRSRSRLRNLKFWRKKREMQNGEVDRGESSMI